MLHIWTWCPSCTASQNVMSFLARFSVPLSVKQDPILNFAIISSACLLAIYISVILNFNQFGFCLLQEVFQLFYFLFDISCETSFVFVASSPSLMFVWLTIDSCFDSLSRFRRYVCTFLAYARSISWSRHEMWALWLSHMFITLFGNSLKCHKLRSHTIRTNSFIGKLKLRDECFRSDFGSKLKNSTQKIWIVCSNIYRECWKVILNDVQLSDDVIVINIKSTSTGNQAIFVLIVWQASSPTNTSDLQTTKGDKTRRESHNSKKSLKQVKSLK